jgi:hypothetical protein
MKCPQVFCPLENVLEMKCPLKNVLHQKVTVKNAPRKYVLDEISLDVGLENEMSSRLLSFEKCPSYKKSCE